MKLCSHLIAISKINRNFYRLLENRMLRIINFLKIRYKRHIDQNCKRRFNRRRSLLMKLKIFGMDSQRYLIIVQNLKEVDETIMKNIKT